MLKNHKYYIAPNSGLMMLVLFVWNETETHVDFRGALYNKSGTILYEIEDYNLPKAQINHWEEKLNDTL